MGNFEGILGEFRAQHRVLGVEVGIFEGGGWGENHKKMTPKERFFDFIY